MTTIGNGNNEYTIGQFGERIYAPLPIQRRREDTSDSPLSRPATSTSAKYTNSNSVVQNVMPPKEYLKLMKDGRERLRTFTEGRWPVSAQQSPIELAESGFFYLGDLDRVQCAFCKLVLRNWSRGDNPIWEHFKGSRHCDFIQGFDVGNKPIEEDPVRGPNPRLPNFDVCGNQNSLTGIYQPMPRSVSSTSEDEPMSSEDEFQIMDRFDPLSYDEPIEENPQAFGPQCPEMASNDARLKSFKNPNWPVNCPVKPVDLADAGLFYIGKEDHVKCFYCNGGICGWETGDEPWSEHKRLFPACAYVKLNLATPSVSSESEEENETDEVINSWFNDDLVKSFIEQYHYSKLVVKNVLRQRYLETKTPFANIEELHASVSAAADNPLRLGSQGLSEPSSSQESTSSAFSSVYSQSSVTASSASEDDRDPRLLCKVCLDREIGVVFLPCGHHVSCTRCAPAMKKCPICRQVIHSAIRAFLS